MGDNHLVIDGYLSRWEFSRAMVRNFLNANSGKPVNITVSSFGGEVDQALSMYNDIATHGNVTVTYSAFNASAATLLGLSASNSRMFSNGFFLIHKALRMVDIWKTLNSDDIEALIAQLEKDKKELEKVTLVLATMYIKKTGKTISEILDLMKEETWLTAQEALDYGFIDEVIEPEVPVNHLESQEYLNIINAAGLPVPARINQAPGLDLNSTLKKHTDSTVQRIMDLINRKFQNTMKKFSFINKLLKIEALESADDKGVYLNEEQLSEIEAALSGLNAEQRARQTAETELQEAMNELSALDPTVATAATAAEKAAAVRALLASRPGTSPVGVLSKQNPNLKKDDGVDWDLLNSLPHMQETED